MFLDEIGDLSLPLQAKILRLVQERQFERVGGVQTLSVDVRVVAATNRDLKVAVAQKEFREDLFFRLSVFPVEIPPLRRRRGDIPLLAEHFLLRIAELRQEEQKSLSGSTLDALVNYSWPGNVRELENALERAVILTPGNEIQPAALPERVTQRVSEPLVAERTPTNPTLEAVERAYIMWVLQSESGNKSRAAEVLGIDPSTLYRKLSRYGVEA